MLGIVQGRLSHSGRKLQFFPKNPYKEFKLASKIGYDFIEFFGERMKNFSNPIWTDYGIKKYLKVSKQNNIKIYSFCDDYIINHTLSSKKTLSEIINTIQRLGKLKIKKYILPLYGKSQISTKNRSKIFRNLSSISQYCKKNKIQLLLESNMGFKEFMNLKKKINSKNCFFLFDTGNRINLKRDIYSDLKNLLKFTMHIHLKDKNKEGKNVKLNTGLVNFRKIFYILKKDKYKKGFTFETTRGSNPIKMAKFNIDFLKKNFK